MSIDIKLHGKVYKHIIDAVQANYGRHTRPWKYDNTRIAMARAAKAEHDANKAYPIGLHEALSDVILEWCQHKYKEAGKEDITKVFQRLWQFNKKWLLIAENHTADQIMGQMDNEATNEINAICFGNVSKDSERANRVTDLYAAVMEYVVEMAKDEDVSD